MFFVHITHTFLFCFCYANCCEHTKHSRNVTNSLRSAVNCSRDFVEAFLPHDVVWLSEQIISPFSLQMTGVYSSRIRRSNSHTVSAYSLPSTYIVGDTCSLRCCKCSLFFPLFVAADGLFDGLFVSDSTSMRLTSPRLCSETLCA